MIRFKALDSSTWNDFVELFGEKGACGGCWCMNWRLSKKEFDQNKGDGNKNAMYEMVEEGIPLGVIGYQNNKPFGWCSVSPRDFFVRLENSRIHARIDDTDVWSISCLFLSKEYRQKGFSEKMIAAAVNYASQLGAYWVEAYPFDNTREKNPDPFVWTGISSAYYKVGFKEVARRSPNRPVLRIKVM
jgi:GNAT superfamily N-acetyltransferase